MGCLSCALAQGGAPENTLLGGLESPHRGEVRGAFPWPREGTETTERGPASHSVGRPPSDVEEQAPQKEVAGGFEGGQPQVWEQHAFSRSPLAPINLPWARSGGPGSFPPAPASPRARLEEVPRPPSAVGRTLPPWSQGRSRETRAAAQGRVVLPQHGHGYAHSPQGRDDSKRQPNNLEMLSVWRTCCLSFNMVYYTLI